MTVIMQLVIYNLLPLYDFTKRLKVYNYNIIVISLTTIK